MTADEYTCALCGGTFSKARSDEEALAEMRQLFGEVPPEEREVVCDDCWEWMERERKRRGLPYR